MLFVNKSDKSKVFLAHAMKVYMGGGGGVTGQLHALAVLTQEKEQKDGWVPECVWTV